MYPSTEAVVGEVLPGEVRAMHISTNTSIETLKFDRVEFTKRIDCLLITESAENFRKLS